jgi:hypothetical protein
MAVKVFTVDFHALGIAGGLAESLDHGIDGLGGFENGFSKQITDEPVQACAALLGVFPPVF